MHRLLGLSMLLALGCPGSLENPDQFAGEGGVSRDGGGECDAIAIFRDTNMMTGCGNAACHDSDMPYAGLDLTADDLSGLVDRPAASGATDQCGGMGMIIDGTNPADSLLILKLSTPAPCGLAMPFGTTGASEENIACITAWVNAQAGM
jgi:hypothetical protein